METARYDDVERPDKDTRDFVEKPRKVYWKYRITAVPGLQIIPAATATPGNLDDANMPVAIPDEIQGAAASSSRAASFMPARGILRKISSCSDR